MNTYQKRNTLNYSANKIGRDSFRNFDLVPTKAAETQGGKAGAPDADLLVQGLTNLLAAFEQVGRESENPIMQAWAEIRIPDLRIRLAKAIVDQQGKH